MEKKILLTVPINSLEPENDKKEITGVKFDIDGLHCANCAAKIEAKLNNTPGIHEAVLNFTTKKVVARSDLDRNELMKLIQSVVDSVENGVTVSYRQAIKKQKLLSLEKNWNLIIGIPLYAAGLITDITIIIIAAYVIIGYDVLKSAIKNIINGDFFDENFLMSIATIGAILVGQYSEAVGVMLFYGIGELFQDYAVDKSRESISNLMGMKTDTAMVKKGKELVETEVGAIPIGSTIVVKVGQGIPLDGVVSKGNSTLNMANLNGESLPVDISSGDEVLSGSVNLSDILEIETTKMYEDSTMAKIIELLEESASRKAPIEQFVTRFSKKYTPTVIALAAIVGLLFPLIFPGGYQTWIYRALIFLVVSCPCSIVVSVPLTLYAGIGRASKVGALVKGSNFLEQISKVETIVLDKTGTITKGEFEVKKVHGDILEIMAYGEALSNHPIALSITKSYNKPIDQGRISNFKEYPGNGIVVEVDCEQLIIGKHKFLKENNIDLEALDSLDTVIYIAKNGVYAGAVEIGDQIKDNSLKTIQEFNKLGIKTVMLTGDNEHVANYYGDLLGIDEVHAGLMPGDKVNELEKHLGANRKVAFVGDGINDGPVLMRSDIGISMGTKSSDLAKHSADVVLINDDLLTIVELIKISLKTNKILIQNIVFSIVIKLIIILLATLGIANMWIGVFGDVGVTLLAILNSLRTMK